MKKELIVFILLVSVIFIYAQIPDWESAFDAGSSENDYGYGIVLDDSNNIYVTGAFRGTAYFGSYTLESYGEDDIFIAKMNPDGIWQWANKAGGNNHDSGKDIVIDNSGNIYIIGYFSTTATFGTYSITSDAGTDVFVAKMNSEGSWQWVTKASGNSDDFGYGITIDELDNLYVIGYFKSGLSFAGLSPLSSAGDFDIFVAKLDHNGIWQWASQGGAENRDKGYGIGIDHTGNIFVAGMFDGSAYFGDITIISNGAKDIFVAKLDYSGAWQWVINEGGNSDDYGFDLKVDSSGDTYIMGFFKDTAEFTGLDPIISEGLEDIFIAKINSDGIWQWVNHAGGTSIDCGYNIAIDDYGNSFVTGYFNGTANFPGLNLLSSEGLEDIYIAKLNEEGNWQWVVGAGGLNCDKSYSIAIDNNGYSYITGNFNNSTTFGSIDLTSNGGDDIFVAKLESDLNADFYAIPNNGYAQLDVEFFDQSIGNITSWEWDFENDGLYDSTYYSYQDIVQWSYENAGTYSVKLKISNETFIDSLIIENYVIVEYCAPASPQNVNVDIIQPDAIISWAAVDTTECGSSITPDGYIIKYSENEDDYFFLNYTSDLNYLHTFVAQFSPQMFYQVIAFKDYSRYQIEYLEKLNNSKEKIKWVEVKRNLESIRK